MKNLAIAVRLFAALAESQDNAGPGTLWSWAETRKVAVAQARPEMCGEAKTAERAALVEELEALAPTRRERVLAYTRSFEPLSHIGEAWLFSDEGTAKKFQNDVAGLAGTSSALTSQIISASGPDTKAIESAAESRGGALWDGPELADAFESVDTHLPFDLMAGGASTALMQETLLNVLEGKGTLHESLSLYGQRVIRFAHAHPRILGVDRRLVEASIRGGYLRGNVLEAIVVRFPALKPLLHEQDPVSPGNAQSGQVTIPVGGGPSGAGDQAGVAKDQNQGSGTPAQSKTEPQPKTEEPTEPGKEEKPELAGQVKLSDGTVVPEEVMRKATAQVLKNLAAQLEQGTVGGSPEPKQGDGEEEEEEKPEEEKPAAEEPKPEEPAPAQPPAPAPAQPPAPAPVQPKQESVTEGMQGSLDILARDWKGQATGRGVYSFRFRDHAEGFMGDVAMEYPSATVSDRSKGSNQHEVTVTEAKMTKKGQAFVGGKIKKHIKKGGKPQKQAVAIALSQARKKGFKGADKPKKDEALVEAFSGSRDASVALRNLLSDGGGELDAWGLSRSTSLQPTTAERALKELVSLGYAEVDGKWFSASDRAWAEYPKFKRYTMTGEAVKKATRTAAKGAKTGSNGAGHGGGKKKATRKAMGGESFSPHQAARAIFSGAGLADVLSGEALVEVTAQNWKALQRSEPNLLYDFFNAGKALDFDVRATSGEFGVREVLFKKPADPRQGADHLGMVIFHDESLKRKNAARVTQLAASHDGMPSMLTEQLDVGEEDEAAAAGKGFADTAMALKQCRQSAFDLTTNGLVRLESLVKAVGAKKTAKLLEKVREAATGYLDELKKLAELLNKANDTFKAEGGNGGEAAVEEPPAAEAPAEAPAVAPAEAPAVAAPVPEAPAVPVPATETAIRSAVSRMVQTTLPERIRDGLSLHEARTAIKVRCTDLILTMPMLNEVYHRLRRAETIANGRTYRVTFGVEDRALLEDVGSPLAARTREIQTTLASEGELTLACRALRGHGGTNHGLLARVLGGMIRSSVAAAGS